MAVAPKGRARLGFIGPSPPSLPVATAGGGLPPLTVGVGGVLVRAGDVLLVRLTYGPARGRWTIPGGFQEAGETLAETVEREVLEETGVRGRATRLVALRSLAAPGRSDTYCAFALEDQGGEPRADGREVAEAAFRPLAWALESPEVSALSQAVIAEALRRSGFVALDFRPNPPPPEVRSYVVYAQPPEGGAGGGVRA